MKENSIEEDRKILEKLINTMKSDRELFDEKIDKEIYAFFINALEHILSDYKRVLKENEELKEYKKIAELTKISCCTAQNCEALNNAIKSELENQKLKEELNDINQKWIQKVKDKIGERQFELQQEYKDFEDDAILIVLQELLEGRK